ncbi:sigma-70 family RNA polymerase sigma factor [Phytoactinopolyspora halotolerans]|uniref:Sigma-70 family RNA polymerase sigma factor n=2 Tax=Phytoactinopolyspora halotolerans TaxID=1981512 RepID=A0A6L9S952_9ACTN|nr:sigma-70 family RNA polymerase sigma factor [Phytoactinopolyspora halotolerans]
MADAPDDAELVRAAQAGDVECSGVLLARHWGAMRAVALSILGHRPEADDALQEAALTAVRRIGDVRDAASVGPWLRAIVRNVCRMQVRGRTEVPADQLDLLARPAIDSDPAELLDRHAARDWVWRAIEELSPSLRLVTMLRYFTGVTAYEQIAALCGIPVGTVRSRLSQARTKLTDALLATADAAHDDVAALTRTRRAEATEMLRAAERGSYAELLAATWSTDVETTWPDGQRTTGQDQLIRAMYGDVEDGVRYRLAHVVASRGVTILETDLISPPDDPFHCPPGAVWVLALEDRRVRRLRLFHPER